VKIGCHRRVDTNFSDCQDACSSGPTKKTQDIVGSGPPGPKLDDSCCSANSTDNDCKNRISSTPEPSQAEDPDKPSCCKDHPSPCCDVSCLDCLALRACDSGKQVAWVGQASKSKHQCSLQSRCLLLTPACLQLPLGPGQTLGAVGAEMESHAATTLVPPAIPTRLPWKL
jgi:hypothetical protein